MYAVTPVGDLGTTGRISLADFTCPSAVVVREFTLDEVRAARSRDLATAGARRRVVPGR